jgi:hypothetical protein
MYMYMYMYIYTHLYIVYIVCILILIFVCILTYSYIFAVYPSIFLSIHPSIYLSICSSMYLCINSFISLPTSLFVCICLHMCFCVYIYHIMYILYVHIYILCTDTWPHKHSWASFILKIVVGICAEDFVASPSGHPWLSLNCRSINSTWSFSAIICSSSSSLRCNGHWVNWVPKKTTKMLGQVSQVPRFLPI